MKLWHRDTTPSTECTKRLVLTASFLSKLAFSELLFNIWMELVHSCCPSHFYNLTGKLYTPPGLFGLGGVKGQLQCLDGYCCVQADEHMLQSCIVL